MGTCQRGHTFYNSNSNGVHAMRFVASIVDALSSARHLLNVARVNRSVLSLPLIWPQPVKMSTSLGTFGRALQSPFSKNDVYSEPAATAAQKKKKKKNSKSRLRKVSTKSSSGHKKQRQHKQTTPSIRRASSISTHSSTLSSHLSTLSTHSSARSTHSSALSSLDSDSPVVTRRQSDSVSFLRPRPRPAPLISSHSSSEYSTPTQLLIRFNPIAAASQSAINVRLSHTTTSRQGGTCFSSHGRRRGSISSGSGTQRFTIEDLAHGLAKMQYKKIIVMSGAGISTGSGIPDFRTPGTGLYDNLKQYRIPEPSAIFDITFFSHNPRPFFELAKELYPGKYLPNPVHYFIRLLQEKGFLHRNYTQNIDGLERLAGVKAAKLVEAHGSFSSASCTLCHAKHNSDDIRAIVMSNQVPKCKQKFCSGVVKPDIVFFGEDLPQRFHSLRYTDFAQCDLLIIMGTSLEVEPFASLATLTRFDVPRVLINRELVGPFKHQRKRASDIMLIGDLTEQINELVRLAGWQHELQQLLPGGSGDNTAEDEIKRDCSTVLSTGKAGLVESLVITSNQIAAPMGHEATPSSSVSTIEEASDKLAEKLNELKIEVDSDNET